MMTQTAPTTLYVGLDVAKLTLQIDLAGHALALANTPAGHRILLTHLRRLQAPATEGTGTCSPSTTPAVLVLA